jgi:hypothetical protein
VLGRGLATAGSILRTVLAPAPGGATGVAGGVLLDFTRSKLDSGSVKVIHSAS